MRLIIPYRKTHNDGIELRYAIRSIQKYFEPLDGVLIIGDSEEWYTGDHIPLADLKGEKEKSMQLKVAAAPDEIFLYSNDDYFALQPFDKFLPNYYDTTCIDMAERHSINSYRSMYAACPATWLNFDIHTPMIMVRDRFHRSLKEMDAQTPIKTTYGNLNPKLESQYLCDLKIRGHHSQSEILQKIKDRPFFSTHDSAVDDNLIAVLNHLYPDASRYEK